MRKVALVACLAFLTFPALAAPDTTAPAVTPEMAAPAVTTPPAAEAATPARLDCDVLKARVDAKLQAKGVPSYTLEIVAAEGASGGADAASGVAAVPTASNAKQVGTCDGGTKRLMYTRGN